MASTAVPPDDGRSGDGAATKQAMRARVRSARAARPAHVRAAEAQGLVRSLAAVVDATGPLPGGLGALVPCFEATATEPDTGPLRRWLAAQGAGVLLPVVHADGPLRWRPDGDPAASTTRPGTEALATVRLMLIPALAVDRAGHRLGQGGGHYDRTLPALPQTTVVVAVVHDDEVLESVPTQAHDVAVDAALTPSGWVALG